MNGVPDPEVIFDGDLLRARLWLPDVHSTALYVTFRHWLPDPGQFSDGGRVHRALARGLAHLHVQSRWNDWFLNAETVELAAALTRLRSRFRTARALGFSMGGYAALRFSADLRLNHALIVSPQVSLSPDVMPEEDRYPEAKGFDAALGDLARYSRPGLAGVIALDPFHRLDLIHARRIQTLLPGMALARLGFGGHPGTAALGAAMGAALGAALGAAPGAALGAVPGQSGGFRTLQRISFSARPHAAQIIQLHRSLRHQSPRYWRERAEQTLRRGRLAAAEAAISRAEALAGLPPDTETG
jgi:hypothetical protein